MGTQTSRNTSRGILSFAGIAYCNGMASRKVSERVSRPFAEGITVNRDKGYIDGVLLCGMSSDNGRDYPWRKIKYKPDVYEGKPANCNHGKPDVDRTLGWFSHTMEGGQLRRDSQGRPRGRLNLLQSHPMTERVFEAAERNPNLFGFSHVAMVGSRYENGREIIESLDFVESIDLVADPATTRGLHESRNRGRTMKLQQVIESFLGKAKIKQVLKLKRLQEMDAGSYGDIDVAVEDPMMGGEAEPDIDDGIWAAFVAAANKVLNDLEGKTGDPAAVKAGIAKIKKLLMAHGDINGDGKIDEMDVEVDDDEPAMESRSSKRVMEALAICNKIDFRASESDLLAIANTAPDKRAGVASRLKVAATGERPRSTARQPIEESRNKPGEFVWED